MEITRSYNRLISTMGFPILVTWHLYIKPGPSSLWSGFTKWNPSMLFQCLSRSRSPMEWTLVIYQGQILHVTKSRWLKVVGWIHIIHNPMNHRTAYVQNKEFVRAHMSAWRKIVYKSTSEVKKNQFLARISIIILYRIWNKYCSPVLILIYTTGIHRYSIYQCKYNC